MNSNSAVNTTDELGESKKHSKFSTFAFEKKKKKKVH